MDSGEWSWGRSMDYYSMSYDVLRELLQPDPWTLHRMGQPD